MDYHEQLVKVIFDKNEKLYGRICKVSEEKGESIESIVRLIVTAGLHHHMDINLKYLYEKGDDNKWLKLD